MGPHKQRNVPAQETRGGDKVDWQNVVVGEPLPERTEEYPEPDSGPLPGRSQVDE